jgi:intracellular multiplication protein IcmD
MISEHKAGRVIRNAMLLSFLSAAAFAEDKTTIGSIATNVTESFNAIGSLILGIAFVAGLGFGVAAIFKFKQHKDNPTQVPVGTPVAMMAISAALVFLPGFYDPLGNTMGLEGTAGGFSGSATALPGGSSDSGS